MNAYFAQEAAKWETAVPGESEHLPACCGDVADCAAEAHERDEAGHDCCAGFVACGVVEYVDICEGVCWCESLVQIADAESDFPQRLVLNY